MDLTGMYVIRKLNTSLDSVAPGEKVLLLKLGTNSSSEHSLSLDGIVKDGALIHAFQLKPYTVASGVITSAAAVAGASDEVLNVVLIDGNDLEMDGGE